MKNKTLSKNMPYVKWSQLPPIKGPNSQKDNYGSIKKSNTFIKTTTTKTSIKDK